MNKVKRAPGAYLQEDLVVTLRPRLLLAAIGSQELFDPLQLHWLGQRRLPTSKVRASGARIWGITILSPGIPVEVFVRANGGV